MASVVVTALVAGGCAHRRAPAPRTEPAPAEPAPGATTADPGAPGKGANASDAASNPRLDPSEVITAEELATIPDPVPGGTEEAPIDPAPLPPPRSTSSSDGSQTAWIWRVQVFASPDRAQAERTAREASERLRETHVIDHDGSLYKVRLGAFSKESDAEPLKRKAVIEGYTGAFRVRVAKP